MMNPLYMLNNLFWLHPIGDGVVLARLGEPTLRTFSGAVQLPCPHWNAGWTWEERNAKDDPSMPRIWVIVPRLSQAHSGSNDPADRLAASFDYPVIDHLDDVPGPQVPCTHPMPLKRQVPGLWIDFYTDDAFIQQETIAAVAQLLYLGATLAGPGRPLNVFYRPLLSDYPAGDNPFGSHYDPFTHSIQIENAGYPLDVVRDHIHHELGHATLGHRIVQPTTPGGRHNLTQAKTPGLAMSEGWAHFVALATRFQPIDTPQPTSVQNYEGQHWEARNASVALSPNIEYNVACALWDLYDAPRVLNPLPDDAVALPFAELYRVYNPTLTTIPNSPLIPNIDDYLDRLIANNPSLRGAILSIRDLNCGYARKVTLRAYNNYYVGPVGESMYAVSPAVALTQKLVLEKKTRAPFAHGDTVHLKAFTGRYLVAENGGNSDLNANRELPNQWESFVLDRAAGTGLVQTGDQIGLKTLRNNYYVTVAPTDSRVKVTSTSRGSAETFTITVGV